MVRYVVRAVVRYGRRQEFLTAFAAWHAAAVQMGLPRYRLYASDWGTYGEVFAEAEYVDSADIDRRITAALANPGYDAAHNALLSHLVEAQMRDYVLIEESLPVKKNAADAKVDDQSDKPAE